MVFLVFSLALCEPQNFNFAAALHGFFRALHDLFSDFLR